MSLIAGKVCLVDRHIIEYGGGMIEDPKAELCKLEEALETVIAELMRHGDNNDVIGKLSVSTIALLKDASIYEGIKSHILDDRMSAVQAVFYESERAAGLLENLEDSYIRERANDIRSAFELVVDRLSGQNIKIEISEPCILMGESLMPTDIMDLDRTKVLALVSKKGSQISHLGIIARSYGIPYIFGVEIGGFKDAKRLVIDIDTGSINTDPSDEEYEYALASMELETGYDEDNLYEKDTDLPIRLMANIAHPDDVALVKRYHASGIGLFRSEFLYLNRECAPSEEEQFESYKRVVENMSGQEVIIRTLDIGADKKAGYLCQNAEANPALGKRAIRLCLENTELFRTQLRALLRASIYGNLKIMYPMITSLDEVLRIKEQIEIATSELKARGLDYKLPKQGIMIETPAAALVSAELAKEVDFFSIGTNDLTQYSLAIDREADGLESYYDPYHEAIFKLIDMTVQNAHRAGISVGVCGELASDSNAILQFVKMGVDELSMAPVAMNEVRRLLESCSN